MVPVSCTRSCSVVGTHAFSFIRDYAFQNRAVMVDIVLDIVRKVTGKEADLKNAVNIHHNYCTCEKCGDRQLWVTRKGATSAKRGEMGIIPGSYAL